jgi:hypothetical protein
VPIHRERKAAGGGGHPPLEREAKRIRRLIEEEKSSDWDGLKEKSRGMERGGEGERGEEKRRGDGVGWSEVRWGGGGTEETRETERQGVGVGVGGGELRDGDTTSGMQEGWQERCAEKDRAVWCGVVGVVWAEKLRRRVDGVVRRGGSRYRLGGNPIPEGKRRGRQATPLVPTIDAPSSFSPDRTTIGRRPPSSMMAPSLVLAHPRFIDWRFVRAVRADESAVAPSSCRSLALHAKTGVIAIIGSAVKPYAPRKFGRKVVTGVATGD